MLSVPYFQYFEKIISNILIVHKLLFSISCIIEKEFLNILFLIKELIPIQSKDHLPFVYFLLETGESPVAAVYRLISPTYITTANFSLSSGFEYYFLTNGDDFETFRHEDKLPIESYSIILPAKQIREMVDCINSAIQQDNRLLHSSSYQAIRFHLIVSESDAGTLRAALERPDTVIPVPGYFGFGPLWKLLQTKGLAYRNEWLYDHINLGMEIDEYEQRLINSLRQLKDLPADVPVYIWHGANAEEQTMLRFLIYFLKDRKNEIILVDTSLNGHFSTGKLSLEEMQALFTQQNNRPINTEEQLLLLQEWEDLSESKAVLRVWQDGVIKDAAEDIYDHYLIEAMQTLQNDQETADFVDATNVIYHVFFHADTFINTAFLEYRLRHLIFAGMLDSKGVPKSMSHYRVKIK